MKAIIDIKTPAGQSLEGFPKTLPINETYGNSLSEIAEFVCDYAGNGSDSFPSPDLHKGDKVVIEIQ